MHKRLSFYLLRKPRLRKEISGSILSRFIYFCDITSHMSAMPKSWADSTEYHSFQAVRRERLSRLMGGQPLKTELFVEYLGLLRDLDKMQPPGTYNIYRIAVAPSGIPGNRRRIAFYTKIEKSFN